MRILFTANPSVGHFLPLLTLARTTTAEDHAILMVSAGAPQTLAGDLPFTSVGPSWQDLSQENARPHPGRVGSVPPPLDLSPADVADFFVRTRLEVAGDEMIRVASAFRPDIVIADAADGFGPLVSAGLNVPWVAHGFGSEVPQAFAEALRSAADDFYAQRGLTHVPRSAYVDPWPPSMRPPGTVAGEDRLPITLDAAASPAQARRGRRHTQRPSPGSAHFRHPGR